MAKGTEGARAGLLPQYGAPAALPAELKANREALFEALDAPVDAEAEVPPSAQSAPPGSAPPADCPADQIARLRAAATRLAALPPPPRLWWWRERVGAVVKQREVDARAAFYLRTSAAALETLAVPDPEEERAAPAGAA